MKCHYFQLEEFMISESVSLAFHCFDFVICSFKWAGTNPVIVEGQDPFFMFGKCFGKLDQHRNSRFLRHTNPVIHMPGYCCFVIPAPLRWSSKSGHFLKLLFVKPVLFQIPSESNIRDMNDDVGCCRTFRCNQ